MADKNINMIDVHQYTDPVLFQFTGDMLKPTIYLLKSENSRNKNKMCLYRSYRHKTFFTISPIQFSTKTKKIKINIMDLRHCVGKETSMNSTVCTQFIVCNSTHNQNLHWNLYICNWSKQYQTKIYQNNLTSTIVDQTPSGFIKSTPTWFSKVWTDIWGFQR
jgi:hypothetical protein